MKPLAYVACAAVVEVGAVVVASVGLLVADVTVPEGALNGGIIGAIIVAGGAVVNWYLRYKKESNEQKSAKIEVDQAAEDRQANRDRKARKDALDEWQQTVQDLRTDRDLDRKELHELRDLCQQEKTEHTITKVRLDQCERDRAELFRRVEALEKK